MAKNTLSGADALGGWMEDRALKPADVAAAVGVSPAAVYGWLKGTFRPEGLVRDKLEIYTDGAIAADSWLTTDERRELRTLRPYAEHTANDFRARAAGGK